MTDVYQDAIERLAGRVDGQQFAFIALCRAIEANGGVATGEVAASVETMRHIYQRRVDDRGGPTALEGAALDQMNLIAELLQSRDGSPKLSVIYGGKLEAPSGKTDKPPHDFVSSRTPPENQNGSHLYDT